MPDWTRPMQQTFEYYVVDPVTWHDKTRLDTIKSSSISWDSSAQTLGSATFDIMDTIGECYIRTYLVTMQDKLRERTPLGTFLIQTPSSSFDGMVRAVSVDAYTPLIELKEKSPPIGYSLMKDENIMENAYRLASTHTRTPVVKSISDKKIFYDFVAASDDTWLTFLTDWIAAANYTFNLDETSQIIFAPVQDISSLRPVWTYTDDNSSILYPDCSLEHDIYGIPNVVEVVYSSGNSNYYAKVVNDDTSSPISTINRGREIPYRVINPDGLGNPTNNQIQEYANQLLRNLSALEYTVTYKHGYCPVRIGDCVRLNYSRAGLSDIKVKVTMQKITCEPGCPVEETAVFTKRLWG